MSEKLIMFHGFDQDEVLGLMRLLKANIAEPRKVAFCMTTENNLEWKIRDLISDVVEEHAYMLKREDERAAKREAEE
ncbi:DUF3783 domain-containing protein [Marispirochaeta aestuarii]|uniref:DUF3783 domain-containing protein n=1 Tax=Marispirochaeta aestuarii TaxID=1963862 RepID=UPI0029C992E3|nr:DUF3783 domain-containing protein [Marispirochaeta aestuarii]